MTERFLAGDATDEVRAARPPLRVEVLELVWRRTLFP